MRGLARYNDLRLVGTRQSPASLELRRAFTSSPVARAYQEPPHMVDTEVTISPKQVKVPYLSENVRQELYRRHKKNPDEWPLSRLAQHYGASLERTKAVLILMRKREELMASENLLDIPEVWHEIWKRHSAPAPAAVDAKATKAGVKEKTVVPAPEVPVAGENKEVAAGDAQEGAAPAEDAKEALAKEFGLKVEEVGDIISRMSRHMHRQSNLDAHNKHMESIMERLSKAGVDISFRETGTAPKRGSIQEDYYPTLFGDEDFETAKKELLDRIASETKAEIVDFEASLFGGRTSASSSEIQDTSAAAAALKPVVTHANKANVKIDTLSRWKFAFRDSSWRRTQPTMLRTRRGAWRQANALEDAMRSWNKHPTLLDLETFKAEVLRLQDPDADEKEASQLSPTKLKANDAKRAAMGGEGAKK